ncbi:MAG TPA: MerR family transcriptional regulator [Pseudolabrys sp.]|nr:MerR family transcriptional regulator [Pseudolabrys sp.]
MDNKAPDAFRTISEVAEDLDLPQHVLRFWESRFHEIKPMKRGGGRRYYRPDDIDLLRGIRHLLYGEGYTIRGVQRILREHGSKFVQAVWQEGAPQPPHGVTETEEFADEAVETTEAEEDNGLRSRFSSLMGRDLGRQDAAPDRMEPPLTAAPVPRVEQVDRAIHSAGLAQQAPAAEPAPAPASTVGRIGREDLRKLQTALEELVECRKLLDSAITRPH